MKLYYSPGACSLSPHIALCEAGITVELVRVDLKTKKTADGSDFNLVNAKGYVPALQLDNGQVLTEGPAIVQYIADQHPNAKLAPANGTIERARLQEWLNFTTSEIHKNFSPLFNPSAAAEWKDAARSNLAKRFDYISKHLEKQPYLLGETFSVADGYLFTVLSWTGAVDIDRQKWPVLQAFFERVAARPAVQKAMEDEGLKKK